MKKTRDETAVLYASSATVSCFVLFFFFIRSLGESARICALFVYTTVPPARSFQSANISPRFSFVSRSRACWRAQRRNAPLELFDGVVFRACPISRTDNRIVSAPRAARRPSREFRSRNFGRKSRSRARARRKRSDSPTWTRKPLYNRFRERRVPSQRERRV